MRALTRLLISLRLRRAALCASAACEKGSRGANIRANRATLVALMVRAQSSDEDVVVGLPAGDNVCAAVVGSVMTRAR